MPPPNQDYVGQTLTVSGWGTGNQPWNLLNSVDVPYISNSDCNANYENQITSNMMCAGYLGVGGKDSCQGDSGGKT